MIKQPDITPILRAVEAARMRLAPLRGGDLASAACAEMQKIIEAKNAYDEEIAEHHTSHVLNLIFPGGTPR